MDTYEKKYNEALERARKIHNEILDNEILGFPDQIREIFPELRESEDERIRKWIIEELKITRDSTSGKNPYSDDPDIVARLKRLDEAIDYLEKQKEQKPVVTHGETYHVDTLGTQQVIAGKMPSKLVENDCRFIDEKFMETDFWKQYVKDSIIPGSKPTQQDIDFLLPQAKNLFALATKDMCNGCKDWSRGYNAGLANAEKAEREKSVIVTKQEYDSHSIVTRDAVSVKPAKWSEEDKRAINDAIVSLSEIANGEIPHLLPSILLEVVERLKSLCPQPQQNMSISFMLYLDEIRPEGKMCLSNGECNDIEDAFKKQDWPRLFKYINKYQPHWKPSEEQMKQLHYALTPGSAFDCDILNELYIQLKKLK